MSVGMRRILVALAASAGSSAVESASSCRSNQTHIAWTALDDDNDNSASWASKQRQRLLTTKDGPCCWQTLEEAKKDSYDYLRHHVMAFDLPFLETMGFQEEESELPDGLGFGLIGETIHYALQAKIDFAYTDQLPWEIWLEYVLNYANTNEARSNWRPLLWKKLRHLANNYNGTTSNSSSHMATVVHQVNAQMWTILAPADQKVLYFKPQSTPLVFDPMSILAFGYASCTGHAILLTNALRTLGVPARVVGTAAWNQNRSQGNHNWVEVWTTADQGWRFLEPSLSGDPNTPASSVDDLDSQPCNHWFCEKKRYNTGNPANGTLVYAARLEPHRSTFFPVAWEWSNQDVPGEDVTAYYQQHCGEC